MSVHLFYKYGTIFRPIFVNFDNYNACNFNVNQTAEQLQNPLAKLFYTALKRAHPRFLSGCPYKGYWDFPGYDPNEKLADLLPPIVPAGNKSIYCFSFLKLFFLL